MRSYALRLHESGMHRNSPNRLLAERTDYPFVAPLRRELKTLSDRAARTEPSRGGSNADHSKSP